MLVKDLIVLLQQYDQELEVIVDKYSDYSLVARVHLMQGVPQSGYIMDPHYSMSDANKAKQKTYLHIVT